MAQANTLSRRRLALAGGAGLLLALAPAAPAATAPAEVSSLWPQARRVGQGRLRFFGLQVYDAQLWAPGALTATAWPTQAFALELQYARRFEGAQIADRSLEEMRRQGPIAAATAERWLAQMKATFPDVRDGDRLSGLHLPGELARFFHNGAPRGEWRDMGLARHFFGIWLAPQSSEPALREALLGGRA